MKFKLKNYLFLLAVVWFLKLPHCDDVGHLIKKVTPEYGNIIEYYMHKVHHMGLSTELHQE